MAGRFPDPNFGGKQEQERFRVENYPEQKVSPIDPCPWLWVQHPQLTITVGPRSGPPRLTIVDGRIARMDFGYGLVLAQEEPARRPLWIVPTKREERHG